MARAGMGGQIIGIDVPALMARVEPGIDAEIIRHLINELELGTLEGVAEARERELGDQENR